jgi:molecular chaperone DnaK
VRGNYVDTTTTMPPIIGIDLGSEFSAIAKLNDNGMAEIIPVDGERSMASCVYAPKADAGMLKVGAEARNMLGHEPESVVKRFRRDIGTDKVYPLRQGLEFTPVIASAAILRKLTQEASKVLGPIHEVVITVPANFAERQRKATIEAGELAGLKVTNIINEPTAAILAYASQKRITGTVMIYDLGRCSFDVTIAKVKGAEVECLTSEGDSELGGMDFDQKIAMIIDQKHAEQYGRTLREALNLNGEADELKSTAWQSLLCNAEECKKTLSKMTTAPFSFFQSPDGPMRTEVTRQEFERAISSLIARTEMRVETALDKLSLRPEDIDEVLLVGGSARVPAVKSSLKRIFGREPSEGVNLDEAVALGAAIYAGLRADQRNLKPMQRKRLAEVSVTDVANHYYGMLPAQHCDEDDPEDMRVSIIIPKNTPLPCSRTERIYTRFQNQRFVRLRVTHSASEETDPDFVNLIADIKLGPLPPDRSQGQPIEITYSYDIDQTMRCKFLDVNSGMKVEIDLHPEKCSPTTSVPDFPIEGCEITNDTLVEPRRQIFVPDFEIG